MPSSKFNKQPVARRRPAICIAPAGSCLPAVDPRRPEYIHGCIQWLDLDPLGPADSIAILRAGPRQLGGEYSGEVTLENARLGVILKDEWPTPTCIVQIWLFDPWRPPEYFTWPDVPLPLEKDFDTHLLTYIHIPAYDLRMARFML